MSFKNRNLGVCVCEHVFDASRPVLLVLHYSDGEWGFFCGKNDHSDDYRWIGIGHILDRDETIGIVSSLPKGSIAERSSLKSAWDSREETTI